MGKQDAFQKPSLVFQGLQPLVRAAAVRSAAGAGLWAGSQVGTGSQKMRYFGQWQSGGGGKIVFYISFLKWPSRRILFLGHTHSMGVLSHTTPPGQLWWAGGPRILLLPWEREGQAKGSITDNGNMP